MVRIIVILLSIIKKDRARRVRLRWFAKRQRDKNEKNDNYNTSFMCTRTRNATNRLVNEVYGYAFVLVQNYIL